MRSTRAAEAVAELGSFAQEAESIAMRRLRTAAAILCVLASCIACLHQFSHSHLMPIIVAVGLLLPTLWLRSSWFRWAVIVPIAAFSLLLIDAFCLRHRLAVEIRAWSPIFDVDVIEDRLVSPSGRTTVYVVGSYWLDSSHRVYVSHGHLFPDVGWIETGLTDPSYPRDVVARWRGPFFAAGESEQSLSVAYDERDDRFYTYSQWTEGGYSAPRTREDFTRELHHIEATGANKTDAGNCSNGICPVSHLLRSPSPDPSRSAK